MRLSARSIKELIQQGKLSIEPYREENLQASSIDLTLGAELLLYKAECIDIKSPHLPVEKVLIPKEGFLIPCLLYTS
ncbi:MAG: dCTP deaminase, partial [Aquificaceae bacterium]|nr:dCTP deaminase [Aquificaceae bacterium]